MINRRMTAVCMAGVLLATGAAQAHPGHDHAHGLAHGFMHPLLGLDHLLAMVAVGLWAARRGGRAVWAVPGAFLAGMTAGAAAGFAGVPLPAVEWGIALSVLVTGLMVVTAVRMPSAGAMALVSTFAVLHGHAHAAEAGGGAFGYLSGFLVSTALLHAAGVATALAMRGPAPARLVRLAGAGIAAAGAVMVIGAL